MRDEERQMRATFTIRNEGTPEAFAAEADALIERNPRNASLLRERAEVFYFSNRMGAALDDVNKSIDFDPRDPYSYLLRAQIRYAKGDKEFARRDLNQALELGLNKEEVRDLNFSFFRLFLFIVLKFLLSLPRNLYLWQCALLQHI